MSVEDPHWLEDRFRGERPVRTLLSLFRPQWGRVAVASLAFVVKHSPIWAAPLLTANIIDVVVKHSPIHVLWWNAAVMVGLVLQNLPVNALYIRSLSLAIRDLECQLRSALCRRLQELSIGYHKRTSAGLLQTKVVRDVENIEQMVRQSFDAGLGAVTTILGALVVTAIKAPAFLPVFLLTVPGAAYLVIRFRSQINWRNQQFRRRVERMSSRVNEMTHLVPITRAHGLEADALSRVDESVGDVREAGLALDVINGRLGALSWTTFQLLGVIVLVGAAWVAYAGLYSVSVGDVVMLSSYFVTLTGSMNMLMGLFPTVTKGLESVRSVGEVLQAPDLERNAGKQPVRELRGGIDFDHVGFVYEDTARPAIRGFSLSVAPGETIALVGPSGSGKSTILNLIIGFISPTSGHIRLDGRDMAALDLRTVRRYLAVVPQESVLFEGTVQENVGYGLPGATDAMVRQALRDANALDFVEDMPLGMQTMIGDRGALLSGGQKQRLAIARALVRNPRILILDEATSALDTSSELLIQQALGRLMQGRTTFVAAHRLTTIRDADRIVVMHDGSIVELGSHEKLTAQGGVYASLQAAYLR